MIQERVQTRNLILAEVTLNTELGNGGKLIAYKIHRMN